MKENKLINKNIIILMLVPILMIGSVKNIKADEEEQDSIQEQEIIEDDEQDNLVDKLDLILNSLNVNKENTEEPLETNEEKLLKLIFVLILIITFKSIIWGV